MFRIMNKGCLYFVNDDGMSRVLEDAIAKVQFLGTTFDSTHTSMTHTIITGRNPRINLPRSHVIFEMVSIDWSLLTNPGGNHLKIRMEHNAQVSQPFLEKDLTNM